MTDESDGTKDRSDAAIGASAVGKAEPKNPIPSKPATEADLDEVEKRMSGFERSTLRWTRASFVIVLATGVFICLQWLEMRSGGKDTHDLAVAAGKQADKMTDMSTAADKIRQAAEGMVTQDQRIADNAQKALDASNKQSKAVLDANIASSRLDQRAWVGIENVATQAFSETAGVTVALGFFNSGKTPARNVEFGVRYRTTPFPIDGPSRKTYLRSVSTQAAP
jgi:hypothetical protein